jgi:hypothetical protein
MILLLAYLYTYSLLRGFNFEVLLFSSWELSPMMLPLLETFLDVLWNSFQCHHIFFNVFSTLKSSSPQGRLYFWEQPEVIRNQIRGIGWVLHFSNRFLGQKLLDREHLVSWSIGMVKNPIVGLKFRFFFYAQFQITAPVFPPNKHGWPFGLVEWKMSSSTFLRPFLNRLCYSKTLSHSFSPISLRALDKCHLYSFLISHKIGAGSIPCGGGGLGIFLFTTASRTARGPLSLLSNGYRGLFPRGKAAGAWRWPLTSIQCRSQECVDLHLHFPIRLHGVVLS